MAQLIGREREIATVLRVAETARTTPVARCVMVEGVSGIGKTALLDTVEAAAREWFAVGTVAYEIQRSVSFAVARRLLSSTIASLGAAAARYLPGGVSAGAVPDQGLLLLRVLQGVTLDQPVFLRVDDVQWADDASIDCLRTLMISLADRPFLLCFAVRSEQQRHDLDLQEDLHVSLAPLSMDAARLYVRSRYEDASNDVVEAIAEHANGRPIDLVALADAAVDSGASSREEVAANVRSATVRAVNALPGKTRELLQMLSLLNEPIEYQIVRRLWDDDEDLALRVLALADRYLEQHERHLRFKHVLLSDAVLETIAVKVPLRRRIIDSLTAQANGSFEDRLQLAEQAHACADHDLAIETLTALALDSAARDDIRLTVSAAERLVAIGEPNDSAFVTFYSAYGRALQFLDRANRSTEVLLHSIEEARRRGLSGTGPLAAQLVLALWFHDQRERAVLAYNRFVGELDDPADRTELYAAALWFSVCDANKSRFTAIESDIRSLNGAVRPEIEMRIELARSFIDSRYGNFKDARTALDRAEVIATSVSDALRSVGTYARALLELSSLGPQPERIEQLRSRVEAHGDGSWIEYLYATYELLAGRYDNVAIALEDALERYADPVHKRRMLAVAAGLSVLCPEVQAYKKPIDTEIHRLLSGDYGMWFMPLAAWYTLSPSAAPNRLRLVRRIVLEYLGKPGDPMPIVPVTPLVISAIEQHDAEVLETIAEGRIWHDRRGVMAADNALARALSLIGLRRDGQNALSDALEECRSLNLSAFEQLAKRALSEAPVRALGSSLLTARERQVAAAISSGKTNREIANELVLSERTIEGHIANIFNKLSVSSRTQIAAWYLRTG